MKMKIVIAIVMLHYNVACLRAQSPTSRSLDYIHDYYDSDGMNGANDAPYDSDSDDYADDPLNEHELQFWEALLKLLKNKYPSFKPDNPPSKFEYTFSGKPPAVYSEKPQRPPQQPPQPIKTPPSHMNNPYQSHTQSIPMNPGPSKPSCIIRKSMCLRRCNGEPRCKKICNHIC